MMWTKVFVLLAVASVVLTKQILIKSLSADSVDEIEDRSKRQTTCGIPSKLTATQTEEILDFHNAFRKNENSSNMNILSYSSSLAAKAQELASSCIYGHDLVYDCAGQRVGQNLWLGFGSQSGPLPSTFKPSSIVKSWADNERPNYNYDTGACSKVCGHYTQVAWASTSVLGCGVEYCPVVRTWRTLSDNTKVLEDYVKNGVYVVCDYSRAGNSGGKPFLKGDACTDCMYNPWISGYTCIDGMCDSCNLIDPDCECPFDGKCVNGQPIVTKLSDNTCESRCDCDDGWWGPTCDLACDCGDLINERPYWACDYWAAEGYCIHTFVDFMRDYCPKTCMCIDPNNPPATCPSTAKRDAIGNQRGSSIVDQPDMPFFAMREDGDGDGGEVGL